uniref:Interferon stimulated exonuclease 20 n=1 Tax=Meleagris gallopavo TaxID=9103 RepID=G1N9A5_MELGA
MTPLLLPKASVPTPKRTHGPAGSPSPRMTPQGPGSKKRSRRHQRFMERRALLEQRGLLRPRRRLGTQGPPGSLSNVTPRGWKVSKLGLSVSPSTSPEVTCSGTSMGNTITGLQPCLPRPNNYDGDVIYDKYVLPLLPIVDFRTRWSGITKRHMESAIQFRAAQEEILKILKDKIVVGHAIHNDFQALKYFHPKERTRDTSRIPLLNQRAGLPPGANASLKSLARHLLQKKIQVGCKGHSSVEDARTAMELYRLVEVPWEAELARSQPPRPPSPTDPIADSHQYMDDQYWPQDLMVLWSMLHIVAL